VRKRITQLTEGKQTMQYLNIYHQHDQYEITLEQTENGYLLTWGDYVANSWAKGFLTLQEALTYWAIIECDANYNTDRTLIQRTLTEN
jgi:hypothetical protein